MTQPEALRLADELDDIHTTHVARNAAAELRRLHAENERLQTRYEACDKALRQWLDKTAWIQETGRGCELGMHRADAVRQRLSAVEAQRDALLEALRKIGQYTGEGPTYSTPWQDIVADLGQTARAAIKAVEEQAEPVAQQAEPVGQLAELQAMLRAEVDRLIAAGIQPQRKLVPLTEEEIMHIGMTHQSLRQVVRAVERAHGIKE